MPPRLQEVERPTAAGQVAPTEAGQSEPDRRPGVNRESAPQQVKPRQARGNQDALDGRFGAGDLAESLQSTLGMPECEIARSFCAGQPDSWQPPERVDKKHHDRDRPNCRYEWRSRFRATVGRETADGARSPRCTLPRRRGRPPSRLSGGRETRHSQHRRQKPGRRAAPIEKSCKCARGGRRQRNSDKVRQHPELNVS